MSGHSALNIANFYIQVVRSFPDDAIDNLKLNKLLYYVQGWSLVRLDRPFFSDEIQAWEFGPVVPQVYHQFKACGRQPIEEPEDFYDESHFSSDELDLLIDVYRKYGRYTGWALKEMTHKPGSPWANVFVRNQNNVISHASMKDFFRKDNLPGFDINTIHLPVVNRVPASWDTEEDAVYD